VVFPRRWGKAKRPTDRWDVPEHLPPPLLRIAWEQTSCANEVWSWDHCVCLSFLSASWWRRLTSSMGTVLSIEYVALSLPWLAHVSLPQELNQERIDQFRPLAVRTVTGPVDGVELNVRYGLPDLLVGIKRNGLVLAPPNQQGGALLLPHSLVGVPHISQWPMPHR
jgi:hypothetical protein